MRDFIELLTDKRFSLKFRILNILSGDYLRNYLAVGMLSNINRCNEILNVEGCPDTYKIDKMKIYITKAKKSMDDVWKI